MGNARLQTALNLAHQVVKDRENFYIKEGTKKKTLEANVCKPSRSPGMFSCVTGGMDYLPLCLVCLKI